MCWWTSLTRFPVLPLLVGNVTFEDAVDVIDQRVDRQAHN
jgi:hypothetical protein